MKQNESKLGLFSIKNLLNKKAATIALGTALSFSLPACASDMNKGYANDKSDAKTADGKCGSQHMKNSDGKCGNKPIDKDMDATIEKNTDGKCGSKHMDGAKDSSMNDSTDTDKGTDGKCGEGSCGSKQ